MLGQIDIAAHKWQQLRYGIKAVGYSTAAKGALRLAAARLCKPKRGCIKLKSGPILEFDYPSQAPGALTLFGDFVDPEYAFLRHVFVYGPNYPRVIVDVGAAIGQFSLFCARFPGTIVHAFEPCRANCRTLERNVERNGACGLVRIYQSALSNSNRSGYFETSRINWMSSLTDREGRGTEAIPIRTLAGQMPYLRIQKLDVLKINVAGHEPQVIEGAMPFLEAGRASILILLVGLESLPWYEKLSHCGYRFFHYRPAQRALHEITIFDADHAVKAWSWPERRNIIAVHENAIADILLAGITLAARLSHL